MRTTAADRPRPRLSTRKDPNLPSSLGMCDPRRWVVAAGGLFEEKRTESSKRMGGRSVSSCLRKTDFITTSTDPKIGGEGENLLGDERGQIDLSSVTVGTKGSDPRDFHVVFPEGNMRRNRIGIGAGKTSKQEIVLRARTEEERNDWMKALEQTLSANLNGNAHELIRCSSASALSDILPSASSSVLSALDTSPPELPVLNAPIGTGIKGYVLSQF